MALKDAGLTESVLPSKSERKDINKIKIHCEKKYVKNKYGSIDFGSIDSDIAKDIRVNHAPIRL